LIKPHESNWRKRQLWLEETKGEKFKEKSGTKLR